MRTSRRQDRLLGLRGTLAPDGPRINGHLWNSPDALALVKGAAGADAWLEAWEGLDRFDILPLLVATDGAVAAFGRDIRRLRPNIVISGVDGLGERCAATIGSAAPAKVVDAAQATHHVPRGPQISCHAVNSAGLIG
ncbi:MAG: hypothetical protein H0X67_20335 [Acidobacteria bacterium]|nr:hypothetical protein [Acidobacteriota bacterium]